MANMYYGDRSMMMASPCNFEAMDAELDLNQNGVNEPPGTPEQVNEPPGTPEQVKTSKKKEVVEEQPRKNNRFKRLVRTILTNTVWAKEASNKVQKDHHDGYRTENGEKLTFNLNAFRAHIQTCGKLSPQSIEILSKPASVRYEFEIKIIQKIVYRLKCFDRYPLFVKQELARVIYYDKFEDGRLIIKQGHPGASFYFIVSGAVWIERSEYDPFLKEFYSQRVGELHPGDSFGELALLHNTKRTASIICSGTSEFLRVDKPDFDDVLRNCHQREWEIRINLFSTHNVFHGWSTRELKMANGLSKTKTYPPNTVITSEKSRKKDRVFFIASGNCSVVLRINFVKRMTCKNKYKYVLPPIKTKSFTHDNNKSKTNNLQRVESTTKEYLQYQSKEKIVKELKKSKKQAELAKDVTETRYFVIKELTDGDYFNVGEDLTGLYVITLGRVEVVQVGCLAFSRHGGGRILDEMKATYISKLPTFQQAYDIYVTDKRWKCYKKNLVKEMTRKHTIQHQVDIKEVPSVINTDQLYYLHEADLI